MWLVHRFDRFLTSEQLWKIHEDVPFTRFYYRDQRIESGLLLRWMPDSILIQERGIGNPRQIPSAGLFKIETVTGNRLFEGLGAGILAGAIYASIVRSDQLKGRSFPAALAKLLVPPALMITGMAIGSSKDKKEVYYVPSHFIYNHEEARRNFHDND
jgi:hypothetical protein